MTRSPTRLLGAFATLIAVACSGGGSPGSNGSGGEAGSSGGSTATGGTDSTGGAAPTTGGTSTSGGGAGTETGGQGAQTGGEAAVGGTTASGGAVETGGSGGSGAEGTGGSPPITDAIFVAPQGTEDGSGSRDDPLNLQTALSGATAGDNIVLRGGTYEFATTLRLAADGTSDAPIALRADPSDDERPLLDFSAMSENSSNRGLILSGDYWHVYGIDVLAAGDNGMFVGGSHNVIEFCTFSECADTGLQLGNGASENLVLNCDSYFNADSTLENADGFAAKLDVGTGNKFVGCRAWNNLDDGWDGYLRPSNDITTTYENCWAIDNGKLKNGSVGAGDGNGFKTGGSDTKDLSHHAIYTRCIAAGNVNDGFDHNSNRGNVTIQNSAAHQNGSNINFGSSNIAASLTIKNTISLGNNGSLSATTTDITNNSWQGGLAATNEDFMSVDTTELKAPRKSDGSLPDIDYLKLVEGSDLRNAGTDIGLDYNGAAPDLGPFESTEAQP